MDSRVMYRRLLGESVLMLSGTEYVWLKNPDNWHEACLAQPM
jgi:hypothetical protein